MKLTLKKEDIMVTKSIIFVSILFLTSIPTIVVANSAPDFDYTADKAGVSADLLPYMTLFAGKWEGGPDIKMVVTSFKEKNATITYSWGKWKGEEPGFKNRDVEYNPKKKKLSYRSGGMSFYYELGIENGVPVIKGTMVNPQNRRDHITMRPVEP
jgi:hypothetical protein